MSKKEQEVLISQPDSVINYSDIPTTNKDFWKNAKVVLPEQRMKKEAKSMRFDPELYSWYQDKAKVLGLPTQTLIHKVLESYKEYDK